MDDADLAQQQMEQAEERRRLQPRTLGPEPTGFCYFCDAALKPGERWCGPSCRSDHERIVERNKPIWKPIA